MYKHHLLSRFIWLLLVTAAVLTAVAFPFHIVHPTMLSLESMDPKTLWGWLYHTQLRFQLSYSIGPLVYKEALGAGSILAAFIFFVVKIALSPRSGGAFTRRWKGWVSTPEAWLLVLVLYAGATIQLLSPTPYTSLRTWILLATGILAILMIRHLRPGRIQIRNYMMIITAAGWLIAIVAFLQHVDKMPLLPAYPDPRNRMSSLIGHNTGMSAWLLFPLSFSFYFSRASQHRLVRLLNVLGIALMLIVIVLAQSRAVWGLTALGVGLWLLHYYRHYNFRITTRQVIVTGLIVMLLVSGRFIHPRLDLFGNAPVTVVERLKKDVFNLDQLRRETRLRILVVSLAELVREKPLFGTGIGSFQWVYPIAQGQYFQKHFLDTKLGTTTKRTDLAHNDPLQLVVELGLFGAFLAGGAYVLLIRNGRSNSVTGTQDDRTFLYALLLPAGLITLQSLVDFPFHVIPIALQVAIAVALFSNGTRPLEDVTGKAVSDMEPERSRTGRSALMSGLVMASIAAIPATAAMRYVVLADYIADIYTSNGMNWLSTSRNLPDANVTDQVHYLDRSMQEFRSALQVNILYGPAYEGRATASASRSRLNYILMQKALAEGDQKAADIYKAEGIVDAERAIRDTQVQVQRGELQYHHTYYLVSQAYRMLWRFDADPENERQMNYLRSAELALQRALEFNIADTSALFTMAELLDKFPVPRTEEADKYRRLLVRLDPPMARLNFFDPVLTLAASGEIRDAWAAYQRLTVQFPSNPDLIGTSAVLHFYESVWPPPEIDGSTSESIALEYRQEKLKPVWNILPNITTTTEDELYRRDHLALLLNAAAGNLQATKETAQKILGYRRDDIDSIVLLNYAISRLENKPEVKQGTYDYYRRRALLGLYFLDDRKDSAIALWDVANRVRPTLPEARRLVAYFEANGWWDPLAKLIPRLLEYHPRDPVFLGLENQLQQRTAETSGTVQQPKG